MTLFARHLASIALASLLALPGFAASAQCVSPEESSRKVTAGEVLPLSEALRRAGVGGTPVGVELCQEGGRYVYKVKIRQANGDLTIVPVPAS